MIRTPTKKKIPPPAPKPAPEKVPIGPQKLAELAGMVAEFASDPTYENLPTSRAMIAVQVKNRMGKLEPEEKVEVWKLISPEHQAIFKEYLALADKIHSLAYPKGDDGEDVVEKIKKRRAKESAQNESEPAKT
jgi:hypothetical protein